MAIVSAGFCRRAGRWILRCARSRLRSGDQQETGRRHMTGQGADAVGPAGRSTVIAAVLLMLYAGFSSSLLHLGVRFVGTELPSIEVVFLRASFTLLMTAPFVFRPGKMAWRSNNLPLQILRGGIGVGSM